VRLIVQACILGLLTGGVYALMASGLTLAFGITGGGAHDHLGAYLSYTVSVFHRPVPVILPATAAALVRSSVHPTAPVG
jgi:branched-chain amino acid transport system permease protein